MARQKKLVASAINLTIHPHSDERYVALLHDAFELRRPIRVRGDTHMAMSFIDTSQNNHKDFIHGQIARFTNIDIDRPWFNSETFSEAQDNHLKSLNIPANLRPNMKSISFIFHIRKHMLIFEQYFDGLNVSANQIVKFFSDLFYTEKVVEKYGNVNISIMSDKESIESIMDFDVLKRINIKLLPPNPDDNGDLDKVFEELLTEQNAGSFEMNYKAGRGQSLQPAPITLKLATLAAQNGEVTTQGKNEEGITSTRSTRDHPATEVVQFDPDVTSNQNAFMTAANGLITKLSNLF